MGDVGFTTKTGQFLFLLSFRQLGVRVKGANWRAAEQAGVKCGTQVRRAGGRDGAGLGAAPGSRFELRERVQRGDLGADRGWMQPGDLGFSPEISVLPGVQCSPRSGCSPESRF